MKLVNNKLEPIPNGSYFDFKNVFALLPFDKRHILITTQKDGLFLYDGLRISPFKQRKIITLNENLIYCGILLNDSSFAIWNSLWRDCCN